MTVPSRALAGLLVLLLSPAVPARSPRTGDLATAVSVGADAAVNDDALDSDAVFSVSQEFYWSGANALRGTLGTLDLPGRDDGEFTAWYAAVNVSHNWLRGAVFPYVTGGLGVYRVELSPAGGRSWEAGVNAGVGMEVRLGEAVTLRLEALLHAPGGEAPSPVATGTLGVAVYY